MSNKSKVGLGLLVLTIVAGFSCFLHADINQDPITKKWYSSPTSPGIDQEEYNKLMNACWHACQAVRRYPAFKDVSPKLMNQAISALTFEVLTREGTPTAFRLLADLRKLTATCLSFLTEYQKAVYGF